MEDFYYNEEPKERELVFTTAEGIHLPGIKPGTLSVEVYRQTSLCASLHEPAILVTEDRAKSEAFRQMVATACATMYDPNRPGIGIAANQVGLEYAFCVVDTAWPQTQRALPRVLLNPRILEGDGWVSSKEGCLSVPLGFSTSIKRANRVVVEYRDLDWTLQTWTATGLDAACIQHEYDHLNGTLFIDHLSRIRRQMFERKIDKIIRRREKSEKAINRQLERAVRFNEKVLAARREKAKRMGYEDPSSAQQDGVQGEDGSYVCGVHGGEPESPGA